MLKRKSLSRPMQYKDAVFRHYFKIKENALSLYKAVSGDAVLTVDNIEMVDLDGVYENGKRNDVAFISGNELIVLVEHQSTLNENMPIRFLSYISRYYDKTISSKPLYYKKLVQLPSPRFYVFYNGKENAPEVRTMKLSDAFVQIESQIELIVTAYDIKYERNSEILKKCQQIMYYSLFVSKVEEFNKKGLEIRIAVRKAVEYCIEHDVMKEFMQEHHEEVIDMFTEEWSMEKAKAAIREETKAETVIEMIKDKLALEKIAQYTKLTVEQVQAIAKKEALL